MRRIRARDAAVRRLRHLTAALVAAFGALGLTVAVVAARAFPGHSTHATPQVVRRTAPARHRPAQTAPPLFAVASSGAPSDSSSAPVASAPAPTPAPPVVVSGGS